ncbi:pseudouridine-5'-phosphate glycosidase [Alkalicoccus urumqiensis]|uniref:Pseudouridine-5'-phosphate glycosidase n=1 Tax=Alkalicoccus urumqiensis TaxID=1548213 RepID=A0A2P6MEH9_ALKUR|nr:pseudouridine-5'-phosphate glycosidase [Alkalicoccus urumqiensis]PRO64671.1 pseudouridine-5-phosphate glycosidase [Alkalicoccus urumqiensis]
MNIVYAQEVKEAMEQGKAVVALESTIISHGMPYPQNVKTAVEVEEIIREGGAVPATIAIMDGAVRIGLEKEELEALGKAEGTVKVSRRDIPSVLSGGGYGATTVAATMICADLAGIRVFVTGGIGGVHRGAEKTMDISADLQELAKTNVAVVCAGAKSILDIGRTLEYLETYGVPVVGFETDKFPAFYTRDSGYDAGLRVDTAADLAEMMKIKWDLKLNGGVVVANPVPEESELDPEWVSELIENAVQQAEKEGISGKETTPYLLSALVEASGGKTLDTNIALVKHNAVVGAAVAVSYAEAQN